MDLEIVYIKVPVLVKANRSNVEDVTNEIIFIILSFFLHYCYIYI